MLVLGIDTSSWAGSIALCSEGRIIAELNTFAEKTHARRLINSIHFLLNELELKIKDINGFAVTIGPGSFTGIRIGLATVKGLSLATAAKAVPLSTLYAMAIKASGFSDVVYPMLDAGRNEVYTGCYFKKGGELILNGEELAISPALFLDNLPKPAGVFYGDGALRYRKLIEGKTGGKGVVLDISPFIGDVVAKKGEELLTEKKEVDIATLVPNYIRPSDAELARMKRR